MTWKLNLHPGQSEVYHNLSRFRVVVAGRRWGKTRLSLSELVSHAGNTAGRRAWYIAPTYRMAKQIMWEDMMETLPKRWIRRFHTTEMWVKLANGSMIELRGADKPDTLRGVGLTFVVLDEFQDMKEDVWKKVIRPTLAKDRGRALFIGTPKGYANLYDVYQLGQQPNNNQWSSWQFKTADSPFIPVEEIEQAKKDMDLKSFRQEFLASFESMSGRVYYSFDRNIHVQPCQFNPNLPIWVGQDFNVDPMSSVILQPQPNGQIWAVDEIYLAPASSEDVCDELEKRYWRNSDNLILYPDPAGGQRSSSRGESDLDIFRERGFKRMKYRKKHPNVSDRVNAVNRLFMNAAGDVRMLVDPQCKKLIVSLEQTMYKKGTRDIDKLQSVEHATDALGYPIELEFPVKKFEPFGLNF